VKSEVLMSMNIKVSIFSNVKLCILAANYILKDTIVSIFRVGTLLPSWEHNIKMYLQEIGWGMWTGEMWLRIKTNGKLL
jgi:hypothetical protein